MIILNPGSTHDKLSMADYSSPGDAVSDLSNNPAVLS